MGRKLPSRLSTSPIRRARTRMALLEANPFLWRVARAGRKRMLVWLTLVILFALWMKYARWISADPFEPGLDLLLLVPSGLVLKAWVAAEASRTFSEDRYSGGLELLLSTPLQEKEIVRGQLAALRRQFGPPVIALLLTNLVFLLAGSRKWPAEMRGDWFMIHLVLGGFLAGDMVALSWVGMWLGLTNRKPNRAALQTWTQIVVLPGAIFVVLMALWGLSSRNNNHVERMAFFLWIILGLAADLFFGEGARNKLHAEFRTTVSEGLARKPPAESVPRTAAVLMEAP